MKRTPRAPKLSKRQLRRSARFAALASPDREGDLVDKLTQTPSPQLTRSLSMTTLNPHSKETTDELRIRSVDRNMAPSLLTPAPTPDTRAPARLSCDWFDVVTKPDQGKEDQKIEAMVNRRFEQHLRDLAICQGMGKTSAATSGMAVDASGERTLADVLAAVEGLSSRTAALDGQMSSLKDQRSPPVCSEAVAKPDNATSLAPVPASPVPEEKCIPKILVESEGKETAKAVTLDDLKSLLTCQKTSSADTLLRSPTTHLAPYEKDKELFETFMARYETFASYYQWSDRDKIFHLRSSMGLTAGSVLWDSGDFSCSTAAELITLLKNRFGSGNQKERYRMELKSRRRGALETLPSLYQDIKKLLALAHGTASGDTIETIGIDAFADALNDSGLRKAVLAKGCATLDEAFTVAVRLEAIESTTPVDCKILYGADGQRVDRACARMVSSEGMQTPGFIGLTPQQIEAEFWRSRSQAAPGPTPSPTLYPAYSTSGYGSEAGGMSCVSGPNTSITYQMNQQPRQQPAYQPQHAQNFAPTQNPATPPQQTDQNQQGQQRHGRGKGRGSGGTTQRTPRSEMSCHTCNSYDHFKRECPYKRVQGESYLVPKTPEQTAPPAPRGRTPTSHAIRAPAQQPTMQYSNAYQVSATTPTAQPMYQMPFQYMPFTAQYAMPSYSMMSPAPTPQASLSGSTMSLASSASSQGTIPANVLSSPMPAPANSETDLTQPYRACGVSARRLSADEGSSPNTYIEIQIAGGKHRCLLDSGCDFSLIPYKLVPNAILDPINMDVYAANGSTIKILGSMMSHFEIEGEPVTANLLVSEHIEEFMLGYDWLSQQHIVWDFNGKKVIFRGKDVKLKPRTSAITVSRIYVRERIEIAPSTEQNVPVRIVHKNWRTPSSDWLVKPKELSNGLLVARAILPDNDEMAAVRVLNLTDHLVTVQEGYDMGRAEMAKPLPYVRHPRAMAAHAKQIEPDIEPDSGTSTEKRSPLLPDHLMPMVSSLPEALTPQQYASAIDFIKDNTDVYSKSEYDLGLTTLLTHHINTGDARPVHQQLRHHAQVHLQTIDDAVGNFLECGIVEPASSPWASNVVVVTKQDKTPRITLDYRALNERTYRDSYPLPNINACLDTFKGASWFSVLDLRSSFYQVPLAEEDRDKTAFLTRKGQWRFTRLPMGTCNSPSTFQRLMDLVLRGLQWNTLLVYIDDILVFANSFEELQKRQQEVFERLRWANLKLKPSKVKLYQREITFLGHKISSEGIALDDSKIAEILEWHIPKNVKETRMFLGTVGYFRKYIKDFSKHAAPLHDLTKKATVFAWTTHHQQAFDYLKNSLITAPILGMCRDEGTFVLDVNASDIAAGAVLQQEQDGMERVLGYASKSFDKHERNYCTTRKELAALVFGLKNYRQYLLGRKFKVRTDHAALQYVRSATELFGQQARWLDMICEFNFTLTHRAGTLRGNADGLSRIPPCERRLNGQQCPQCYKKFNRQPKFQEDSEIAVTPLGAVSIPMPHAFRVRACQDEANLLATCRQHRHTNAPAGTARHRHRKRWKSYARAVKTRAQQRLEDQQWSLPPILEREEDIEPDSRPDSMPDITSDTSDSDQCRNVSAEEIDSDP